MDNGDKQYQERLLEAQSAIEDANDQAILKLSSGGLVLSFAFVRQFLGEEVGTSMWALTAAWVSWALSSMCLIVSYWLAMWGTQYALRKDRQGNSPWNTWITARRCRSSSSRTGCRRVKYAPLRAHTPPHLRICSHTLATRPWSACSTAARRTRR